MIGGLIDSVNGLTPIIVGTGWGQSSVQIGTGDCIPGKCISPRNFTHRSFIFLVTEFRDETKLPSFTNCVFVEPHMAYFPCSICFLLLVMMS